MKAAGRVMTAVSAGGLQPQLARALTALSQQERDVVLLVAFGELSHEEIARALAIPNGTVRSRLNRARKKLRAALGQEENPTDE
jgi:RNA polymerase sigma-70 factor (ECF subfamily)